MRETYWALTRSNGGSPLILPSLDLIERSISLAIAGWELTCQADGSRTWTNGDRRIIARVYNAPSAEHHPDCSILHRGFTCYCLELDQLAELQAQFGSDVQRFRGAPAVPRLFRVEVSREPAS